MKLAMKGLVALMAAAGAGSAQAATATGSMNVQITILASCDVVSASDLNFGSTAAIASAIDQTSTITVKCSSTTPYNVGISLGSGGGSTSARRLVNGGNFVTYALYRDSGRTQLWGDTVGTDTVSGTGSGANQSLTVYGRVGAQTVPPPGTYTDVVTVTVTY